MPTFKFPPTPSPPTIVKAPVVEEVDCVLALMPTPAEPMKRNVLPETVVPEVE